MRQVLVWSAAVLSLAVIIHIVAIFAVPNVIMGTLISRASDTSGINTIFHAPRADATSRQVVRPSPDLVYSLCVFDVTDGPIKLVAPIPADTYWSLSAFDDNTNNFFVVNDLQLSTDVVEFVLARDSYQSTAIGGAPVILSPSNKGVVLFRTLIQSEDQLDTLEEVRKQATCAPV